MTQDRLVTRWETSVERSLPLAKMATSHGGARLLTRLRASVKSCIIPLAKAPIVQQVEQWLYKWLVWRLKRRRIGASERLPSFVMVTVHCCDDAMRRCMVHVPK